MSNKKPIPYGKQSIVHSDAEALIAVLHGEYLTGGPVIEEFEKTMAHHVGASFAVAVSSGTAALHLACLAANIGRQDEVITSPMSFAATANCALYVGARPVFADINAQTANISVSEIKARLTSRTRAILPVHYTGLPCDLKPIHDIARQNDLTVIEDACHALGARYFDSLIGGCRYSDMTVFSFHPVKHITTGEGGMILTNSPHYYERLVDLRNHGIKRNAEAFINESHGGWYYEMQRLGYNYRITDMQAALGLSQLKRLDQFVQRRRQIASYYNEALQDLQLDLPFEMPGHYSSYHLYVVKVRETARLDRKMFYDRLRQQGILSQVHYIPIHTFPYYQENLGCRWGDYPAAEAHYRRVLSLPLFPAMTDEEVERVISSVRTILA